MNILIIFYSYSGNTKKVAELLKEALVGQEAKIKNALTVTQEDIQKADILIIGSPIHGYILFGQKLCKEIRQVINKKLPDNLNGKKVILFATYLISPRKALQKNAKIIERKNGKIMSLVSAKRDRKEELVKKIIQEIIVE